VGIYAKYILPHASRFACGLKPNMRQRERVVLRVSGEVLEIGVGSGLNLSRAGARLLSTIGGRHCPVDGGKDRRSSTGAGPT
jgi:hypothetical protein